MKTDQGGEVTVGVLQTERTNVAVLQKNMEWMQALRKSYSDQQELKKPCETMRADLNDTNHELSGCYKFPPLKHITEIERVIFPAVFWMREHRVTYMMSSNLKTFTGLFLMYRLQRIKF